MRDSRGLTVVPAALLLSIGLTACGPELEEGYRARIRRTTHGVAHIDASDLASLGYGEGYAQAEDHLCSIADQIVMARGERARYFGPGPNDAFLNGDLGFRALRVVSRAASDLAELPEDVQAWYVGFIDGYNQYLEETGRDAVPGWCRGADWVVPITTADLMAYHRALALVSSRLAGAIGRAAPPGDGDDSARHEPLGEAPFVGASNGWGLGRDRSASGRGMLIANPHYPWVGSNRFWEKHLVIPGELDVYGVSLLGVPGVQIGFNRAVGWTHTVSAGTRFTLYELELASGDPTRYVFDGEERDLTASLETVQVLQEDGSVESVERRVWHSHFGPVLDFPGVGWTPERVLAIRDANRDDNETWAQWLEMDRAKSLAELKAAHERFQGMPWVNTIATSAEGVAWYTDSSSTPNLGAEALAALAVLRDSHPLVRGLWQRGLVLLPGNDSLFEWVDDPRARDPGVVPFQDMPSFESTDYVFNANDSFWMANSAALLEGDYSPLHGDQRTARSLRTRQNDRTLSGREGTFDLDAMGDALLSNESYAAELLLGELVEHCSRSGDEGLARACEVLSAWDGRYDVDSRGAVLFREWITRYEPDALTAAGPLFAIDFDPEDPVNTPRGLADGALALEHLAAAAGLLESRDIALDVSLGELQYPPSKTPERIPIHGGHGAYEGLLNMQQSSPNTTTLEPLELAPPVEGSRYLTEAGYPVVHGTSFLLALEYTDDGPRAKAFLTYGQSGDPDSPHFTDQTKLYSRKAWRPVFFDEADVAAAVEHETTLTRSREP